MDLRTVGVEEEFLLVDHAGVPKPLGERVVTTGNLEQAAGRQPAGIEHELQQEQAEIGTQVQVRLDRLRADLEQRRTALAGVAESNGVRIAALATSPMPVDPTPTPDPRYLRMMRIYGATAQEQLTCGCHVHVGIGSREEGVAVINAIQPWLSVVLALSANSPFWQGADTGYASYRRLVWDRWPSAGPNAAFAGVQDYDDTVAALLRSKVLLDDAMVYFYARLSVKYPTVEIRVADVCAEVDDAVLVAALCRSLVDAAARAADEGRPWPTARPELLRGAAWRAARSGLDEDLIDPVAGSAVPAQARLEQLVDRIRPSLRRHGDADLVESSLDRLLRRGTGASLQRAAQARTGNLNDVVSDAVHRTISSASGPDLR
jgi:carboxylate-amine ligase